MLFIELFVIELLDNGSFAYRSVAQNNNLNLLLSSLHFSKYKKLYWVRLIGKPSLEKVVHGFDGGNSLQTLLFSAVLSLYLESLNDSTTVYTLQQ